MEQSKITLDSMYAAYYLEFEDAQTVTIPNTGFANYKLEAESDKNIQIYVREVYVTPHNRGKKYAAKLTDLCIEHATNLYNKPVSTVYTSVGTSGNTTHLSLRAITEYGFKLLKSNESIIYFYKENTHE